MNKRALISRLLEVLSADLATLTQAALSAHEAATHAESKAEDQYDTRGLEASYLAGAQSRRAMEIQSVIDLYRHIDVIDFTSETPISATALVELTSEGKSSRYLLMPKGGGLSTEFEGHSIQVVTPQAPMGSALLGRRAGDEIELEIQRKKRDFEITQVW